jgi:predicted Zn finger-like uncharacterized protein
VKFFCSGCKATFSVTDDKIPVGKDVRVLCPRCRIPVERAEEEKKPVAGGSQGTLSVPFSMPVVDELENDQASLEGMEQGGKSALVCIRDTARSYKIEQGLRQLDFYVNTAFSPKESLEKLHRNQYDMVVLEETYGDGSSIENAVLQHFQLLPMHTRRHLFLCLLSEKHATLDRMAAFRLGVDMILNVGDMDKAKILFVRAIKDHKHFYKVFSDELEKRGEF